jgi:hypothetical protein
MDSTLIRAGRTETKCDPADCAGSDLGSTVSSAEQANAEPDA